MFTPIEINEKKVIISLPLTFEDIFDQYVLQNVWFILVNYSSKIIFYKSSHDIQYFGSVQNYKYRTHRC